MITIITIFIGLIITFARRSRNILKLTFMKSRRLALTCVVQILSKNGHWALGDLHTCSDYVIGLLSQEIKK